MPIGESDSPQNHDAIFDELNSQRKKLTTPSGPSKPDINAALQLYTDTSGISDDSVLNIITARYQIMGSILTSPHINSTEKKRIATEHFIPELRAYPQRRVLLYEEFGVGNPLEDLDPEVVKPLIPDILNDFAQDSARKIFIRKAMIEKGYIRIVQQNGTTQDIEGLIDMCSRILSQPLPHPWEEADQRNFAYITNQSISTVLADYYCTNIIAGNAKKIMQHFTQLSENARDLNPSLISGALARRLAKVDFNPDRQSAQFLASLANGPHDTVMAEYLIRNNHFDKTIREHALTVFLGAIDQQEQLLGESLFFKTMYMAADNKLPLYLRATCKQFLISIRDRETPFNPQHLIRVLTNYEEARIVTTFLAALEQESEPFPIPHRPEIDEIIAHCRHEAESIETAVNTIREIKPQISTSDLQDAVARIFNTFDSRSGDSLSELTRKIETFSEALSTEEISITAALERIGIPEVY